MTKKAQEYEKALQESCPFVPNNAKNRTINGKTHEQLYKEGLEKIEKSKGEVYGYDAEVQRNKEYTFNPKVNTLLFCKKEKRSV